MAYVAFTEIGKRRNRDTRIYDVIVAAIAIVIPVVAYYAWAVYLGRSLPPYHVAGSGFIWERGKLVDFLQNAFYAKTAATHAQECF